VMVAINSSAASSMLILGTDDLLIAAFSVPQSKRLKVLIAEKWSVRLLEKCLCYYSGPLLETSNR
jgi:hypothetical protein